MLGKHYRTWALIGCVAAIMLTAACSGGKAGEKPAESMELKVYAVPGGFKDEIRQQLSSAMRDAVVGRVTAGPGDTVIVVAPASFQTGVERTIREFEQLGAPPPPPAPVELRYWLVVGRPLGERGAEGPVVVSGANPMTELGRVLQSIAEVEGPTEFTLLDRVDLTSLEPKPASARGKFAQIEQRTTRSDGRVVAEILVNLDANEIRTQVVLEQGQFVVLGQARYGGRSSRIFGDGDDGYATLYYVMNSES